MDEWVEMSHSGLVHGDVRAFSFKQCWKHSLFVFGEQVLPSLEMLKQLSVRGNSNLTNAFIRSLLNNAPFLERLDMVTCPRINGHTAASQLVRQKHSLNEFLSTQMILSGDGIQGLKNRLVPL